MSDRIKTGAKIILDQLDSADEGEREQSHSIECNCAECVHYRQQRRDYWGRGNRGGTGRNGARPSLRVNTIPHVKAPKPLEGQIDLFDDRGDLNDRFLPKRVQFRRGKALPDGVVLVDRSTKFGNPFKVAEYGRERCLELFREWISDPDRTAEVRRELRGRDLACWCGLNQACHADILIEIANSVEDQR